MVHGLRLPLQVQGNWVQSLVGDQRPHMPLGVAKINKQTIKKNDNATRKIIHDVLKKFFFFPITSDRHTYKIETWQELAHQILWGKEGWSQQHCWLNESLSCFPAKINHA